MKCMLNFLSGVVVKMMGGGGLVAINMFHLSGAREWQLYICMGIAKGTLYNMEQHFHLPIEWVYADAMKL